MLIVLGVSFLAIVIRALIGVHRKRLLPGAFSLLWKLGLVAGVILLVITLLPRNPSAAGVPLPPPKPVATAPLGPVPPLLIWVAAIILAAAVIVLTLRMLAARRAPDSRPWEFEVEQARQALLDGKDLREVIIRCYRRMGEALQEERGIEREASMTTGEFEELLAEKGLPREPVRQLTGSSRRRGTASGSLPPARNKTPSAAWMRSWRTFASSARPARAGGHTSGRRAGGQLRCKYARAGLSRCHLPGAVLLASLAFPQILLENVILPTAMLLWLLLRIFVLSIDQQVYWWGAISLAAAAALVLLLRESPGAPFSIRPVPVPRGTRRAAGRKVSC